MYEIKIKGNEKVLAQTKFSDMVPVLAIAIANHLWGGKQTKEIHGEGFSPLVILKDGEEVSEVSLQRSVALEYVATLKGGVKDD